VSSLKVINYLKQCSTYEAQSLCQYKAKPKCSMNRMM